MTEGTPPRKPPRKRTRKQAPKPERCALSLKTSALSLSKGSTRTLRQAQRTAEDAP